MTREISTPDPLSPKGREILAFIRRVQSTQGAPPTLREIGERFGIHSTNGVRYHLDCLERAGAIQRRPGRARGIGLPRPSVPILGRIAAGEPVFAAESAEGAFDPGTMSRNPPDFALRVRGDSMRDAGILEGDLVLVRRDPAPRNGEIVVAMIGDETTVKRFFRERRQVVLRPANPRFKPITVTETSPELQILGRVVGVYRDIG
jgi:repressor LexA